MNSFTCHHQNKISKYLIVLMVVTLATNSMYAQRYYRPSKQFFVGVETYYGIRSLQLNSNMEEIDRLVVIGDGVGVGLVTGGRAFRVRVQQSFVSSNSYVREKAKLTETNGAINIFPLQLIPKKTCMVSPYFITGIQMSNTKLYGSYVTEPVLVAVPKSQECTCVCHPVSDEGPLADPDAVSSPDGLSAASTEGLGGSSYDPAEPQPEGEDRYLGKISTARATVGIGLGIKIPSRKHVVNFYGEMKYGQPFSSKTTNIAFRDTQVSGLLSIDVGVIVGIYK